MSIDYSHASTICHCFKQVLLKHFKQKMSHCQHTTYTKEMVFKIFCCILYGVSVYLLCGYALLMVSENLEQSLDPD